MFAVDSLVVTALFNHVVRGIIFGAMALTGHMLLRGILGIIGGALSRRKLADQLVTCAMAQW